MKLYKAGAVLLSAACVVSSLPAVALAEDMQQTAQVKTTKDTAEGDDNKKDVKEQKTENGKSQNQLSDKSKKGTIKNSDNKSETDKLSSSKKTEETRKDSSDKNQQTDNKKQKEGQKQEKAGLTNEEAEKQISITSIEDFQKIGTEGYPLDGVYVLQNDIDGRNMETGKNTESEPFINSEEPFTGVINGGGHTIANVTVKRAEEGEQNTSMFGIFSGRLEEINLLNIQVVSEKHSGALIAEQLKGAELRNIILSGKVILSETEQPSEEEQNQRKAATIALQTDEKNWEEFVKGKEQKTKFENVRTAASAGDLGDILPKGLSGIQTNPEYLSTVEGIEEIVEAPKLEGFTFLNWTVENKENVDKKFEGKITNPEEIKTKITGKEGKYRLKAAYAYELNQTASAIPEEKEDIANAANQTADAGMDKTNPTEDNTSQTPNNSISSVENKHTAELVIEVPYIVGKDIKNIEKLIPIDNVFPKQIRATMYLDAIDGVFPKYMEVGKKTDGETIYITSWEQFKNIGNTDYNAHYAMNANYVLKANIYSDGKAFTPIGTKENPFTGSFDGNGFEIDVSNNPEIDTNSDYSGLFGIVIIKEQEAGIEKSEEMKLEDTDKNETEVSSEEER